MAVKVKKKNIFDKMSDGYKSTKVKAKSFVDKEKVAYNIGYNSGLDDYANLPKVVFSRRFAVSGYSKGLSHSHKANKYNNKINRNR